MVFLQEKLYCSHYITFIIQFCIQNHIKHEIYYRMLERTGEAMADLLTKFTEAAKIVSSNKNQLRECVYCAYVDHLSGIDLDDLPEDIQIIYESVEMRLTSKEPAGDIGNDEADYLAKDILYMADVVKAQHRM